MTTMPRLTVMATIALAAGLVVFLVVSGSCKSRWNDRGRPRYGKQRRRKEEQGVALMMNGLIQNAVGIPQETASTFMAVMVIAFAATSLDTGARIQRLVIAELAEGYGLRALTNRYVAGVLGIAAALLLAVTQGGGKGGLLLWPLFGSTNQLVAGVTLLIVSVWLRANGRRYVYTLVPMIAISLATLASMSMEVLGYFRNFSERWLLAATGSAILILGVWVILEGFRVLRNEVPGNATPGAKA